MADANDIALLREFAGQSSEAAFAELVRRHINLVYSVAFRLTGNNGDAQDVTQAVFIALARKAGRLSGHTIITGWLYETTRFTALRLLRTQARRRIYEREASMQTIFEQSTGAELWPQLKPHLEAAMSRLGTADRTLLALRYYENKTGAEAAALLGIREEAARKRTARALEKLQKFFLKCGVHSTASAIATAISANSIQAAPVGLAKTISAAVVKGAAAPTSTLTLAKGALKLMAWTKAQTAIVGVIVISVAAWSVVQHQAHARLRAQNEAVQPQISQPPKLETENQNLSRQPVQAENSDAQAGNSRTPEPLTNQALTAAMPPGPSAAMAASPVRIERDSWTNAGFATPQATLQSRGAAVLNGDRALFAQSLYLTDEARKIIEDQLVQMASASKDPNTPALIQQALNEKWGAEEAILMPMMALNQNNGFAGYQILSEQPVSPDEMILQVETDMASGTAQTEALDFQRFGNDWKIVIDENTVRQSMAK